MKLKIVSGIGAVYSALYWTVVVMKELKPLFMMRSSGL